MASQTFNEYKRASSAGEVALASDDIRFALVMSNSSCATENAGVVTNADFTDVDEMDGTGYTANGNALAGTLVRKDDPNNRAEFDADDTAWAGLANGARNMIGGLLYKFVTNFNLSLPIAYIEFQSAQSPGGSDFTVQWHVEGILHFT